MLLVVNKYAIMYYFIQANFQKISIFLKGPEGGTPQKTKSLYIFRKSQTLSGYTYYQNLEKFKNSTRVGNRVKVSIDLLFMDSISNGMFLHLYPAT